MGTTALEANLQTSTKNCHSLKLISLLRFLKFLTVFSAISLKIDELKALNTAKNMRNLKREISLSE